MRRPSFLLAAISLACSLLAAWSWLQLRTEREKVTTLEQRLAALEARAERSTIAPAPVLTQTTPAAVSAAATPGTPAAAVPSAETTQQEQTRELIRAAHRRQREMLRDPAYRQAQVEQGRRQFAQTRADAIRIVGMTPEQADRVIDLWVERNMRFMDLHDGMPVEKPSEAVQAQIRRAGEAEQAELRELLGTEKHEKWNWYLASSGERREVSNFRAQISSTSEPLGDSQADALVEAIYSERQRRSKEYEEYVKSMGITDRNVVSPQDRQRWLDLEKDANRRIHDTMAGTLSRAQLSSLDEMLGARLVPIETALRMQLEGKLAKSD
jgi:hypothetical protein